MVTPVEPAGCVTCRGLTRAATHNSASVTGRIRVKFRSCGDAPGLSTRMDGRRWSLTEDGIDVTHFSSWCAPETVAKHNGHHAAVLVSTDDKAGIEAVAATVPGKYAKTEMLALIADKYGKPKVSDYLRNKLPVSVIGRSGDLGEILATSYLEEKSGFLVGPSRLIDSDHQELAMRGDDVLGAKIVPGKGLRLVKGEAKSRIKVTKSVVQEAREGLERVAGLPSPHSLTQFAERLLASAEPQVGEAVLELQLFKGVRPEVVTHLMFLFTMNDPSMHVADDLNAYTGVIQQRTITLRVNAHQEFIRDTYEKALADGT